MVAKWFVQVAVPAVLLLFQPIVQKKKIIGTVVLGIVLLLLGFWFIEPSLEKEKTPSDDHPQFQRAIITDQQMRRFIKEGNIAAVTAVAKNFGSFQNDLIETYVIDDLIETGNTDMLKLLLEKKIITADQCAEALPGAVKEFRTAVIAILLEYGLNPDTRQPPDRQNR